MTRNPKESPSTASSKLKTTPIAVIGIGSIFPQARTKQEYWDNILKKINCVSDVPPSRWKIEDYYDPDPSKPDKTYCKRGGFIPDVDFDPMEFGLPPNILEVTDVSQLLALVVAKDALEDAGYGEDKTFDRENTGAVLGVVGMSSKLFTPLMTRLQYPVWERVLRSSGISEGDAKVIVEKIKLAYVNWEENSFPGTIGNVIAGRICNRFDLGGTNCVVDAACASSLAALKMAVSELIEGRANMMITGGVDTDNTINTFMCFSKTPAFSKSDRVRTFDAESDGMMVGEGIGMVVLKRLEDAERDGDRIYAVIEAIGTSSDGRFKSIYAPRPAGQAKALRRAYAEAGFSPATVGLIEAHGTGTMAGDPAEFQGIAEVFGENNPRKQYIALGSVKSQIAHTKAAAGVASLIKTSLSLYHKILPATINVTHPNPKFNIETTPFYINTETRPWIRAKSAAPRRAGVSSFGFGGTNYHVVLQEYQSEQSGAYRVNSVAQPVLLSAASPAQLMAACRETLANLQGDKAALNFANLTLASRGLEVPAGNARVGFVAETVEEAQQALQICIDTLSSKPQEESWEHPKGIYYRKSGLDMQGKVVALFSGQGSQYLEMGRELALNFPVVREVFAEMDELFIQDGLEPLSERVYPRPVFEQKEREALSETLTHTEHAQPAIGSISASLYKLLQQAGFQPDFVAGHSFGELTALWAAGVLNDVDYLTLAKARGKAMAPPQDPAFDAGTMVAVKGEAGQVKAALNGDPGITLANWNSNDQVVIAGSKPDMARAQQILNQQGFKTIPLPVSAAFHTPLVGHAQKPFAKALKSVTFCAPQIKVYSNSTAQPHAEDPEEIRKRLAEHILNPVLFRDEIDNIFAAGGRIFIEFGPKNVLTNLVSNILSGKPHLAVALNANAKKDSDRQLREAVIALRVAGLGLKNFDPYAVEPKRIEPRKKSPVTVKLNAGYYVSEKTRSAYENALKDGFRVSLPAAPSTAPVQTIPLETVKPAQMAPASPVINAQPAVETRVIVSKPTPEGNASMNPELSSTYEHLLMEYQSHQSETLRLHEQYLRTEEEYARAFAQLTQLQSELVSKASGAPGELQDILPLFESLERSMTRFHDHQAETLRVHERYLDTQEHFSQSFVQNIQAGTNYAPAPVAARKVDAPRTAPVNGGTNGNGNGNGHSHSYSSGNGNGNGYKPAAAPAVKPPAAVEQAPVAARQPQVVVQPPAPKAVAPVVTPAPKPAPVGVGVEELKNALLQIVSEKTGYPTETLELDMDMEADLGIDSIKRVEILGAMQAHFPELPKIDNSLLAELRTLGQIVEQFNLGVSTSVPEPQIVQKTSPAPLIQAAVPVKTDSKILTQALLEIVSEKTGYPTETLELDMDMEADLGIDSIKRVEILGAMQTRFPELPQVDNTTLAELCTLGQIVSALSAGVATGEPVEEQELVTNAATELPTSAPASVEASPQISLETVTQALLQIVSEKTGYPVETLELDMDMEADLGIDSIKRVEILGGMQTQFPELPKVEAAELAELRTLGQIVQHLSSSAAPSQEVTGASPFDGEAPAELPFDSGIQQGIVYRKILPQPDALDFELPTQHVCLITDDGEPTMPALVTALLAKNWPVVVLRFPSAFVPVRQSLPEGAASVDLTDLTEAALQTCLRDIESRFGPVAVFIHLTPAVHDGEAEANFSVVEKSLVKMVFLTAKYLKPTLNEAAQHGRAVFMTITRLDGEFGLGEGINFTPVDGGLFGLVKSVNLEWDAVFCRAVDLSPEMDPDQAVRCILAELHDPNRLLTEVGYTCNERSTLALAAVPVTGGMK